MTDAHNTPGAVVHIEANVDDADPRLWPGIIQTMLDLGALDCWLTPIIMKGGRPAVTVHALVTPGSEIPMADALIRHTGSLGARYFAADRRILTREFVTVTVRGHDVQVKVSRGADGCIVVAEPEFRDVAALAEQLCESERTVLAEAKAAALALIDEAR